ncbi:hypothetical protein ACHAWT_000710 [Skeletonema menzelii]
METAAPSTGSSRKRPRTINSNNNNNNISSSNGRGGDGRSYHRGRDGGRQQRTNKNNNNDHVARSRRASIRTDNNNAAAAAVDNHTQIIQQHQKKAHGNNQQRRNNNRSSRLEENDVGNDASRPKNTLPWPNPHTHYIPLHEEERLLPALLHWGKSERGMMKDQPPFRLKKIQKLLLNNTKNSQNDNRCMTLLQSLSLRRTHLKHLQPKLSMPQLKLGSEMDIRHSAAMFEQVVQNYLRRHNVLQCFMTEEDQRRENRRKGGRMPPSPDFRVRDGHCVQLDFDHHSQRQGGGIKKKSSKSKSTTTNQRENASRTINWIEVKMFYGASTIPTNTPNAVGAVLPKMNEYVSLYGEGAIVFMYGCGDVLARQLLDLGVVALDGRGLDVTIVEESQRNWCADARGTILF